MRTEPICYEPYEELANAIVIQAVKDYQDAEYEHERDEIKNFLRSDWYGMLTNVDGDMLIEKLEKGLIPKWKEC